MPKLLILCALEEELPPQHNPYSDFTTYTGIGKVNAAITSTLLIQEFKCDLLIFSGISIIPSEKAIDEIIPDPCFGYLLTNK